MARTISLGRVFGIPIRIDISWFIIFALVSWTMADVVFAPSLPEYNALAHWIMGIVCAVLLFASVLLHELGHSVVAGRKGAPVHGITLFVFGGVAELSEEPSSGVDELKMALAGPITSALIGAVCLGLAVGGKRIGSATGQEATLKPIWIMLFHLARINGVLVVFNLLPGFPLDGGRVFRALLWHMWGDVRRATAVAAWVGSALGMGLIGLGLLSVLTRNFVGLWGVFLGWFLRNAARASYNHTMLSTSLREVPLSTIARRNVAMVPAQTPLADVVNDYFLGAYPDAILVYHENQAMGLLTPAVVGRIPSEQWAATMAGQIADPRYVAAGVDAMDNAYKALLKMSNLKLDQIIVTHQGAIFGIVSRNDIMQLYRVRTQLRI